jgi:hypothetical protein
MDQALHENLHLAMATLAPLVTGRGHCRRATRAVEGVNDGVEKGRVAGAG